LTQFQILHQTLTFGRYRREPPRDGLPVRIFVVIGTRPEAIKMAPVIRALRANPEVTCVVCSTGQHREALSQALRFFEIEVDVDLGVMRPGQTPNDIVGAVVTKMDRALLRFRPDRVLVHGDTSTALAAAICAFNRRLPVAHVEAGLRSFDPARPWPEETNRRMVDVACDLLFAPTAGDKGNLEAERASGRILVTGNTGVDALLLAAGRLTAHPGLRRAVDEKLPTFSPARRLIVVTAHRRENLGEGIVGVSEALARLSRRGDVEIAYVLHPNPAAQEAPRRLLSEAAGVHLLPPQDYLSFVRLLQRADVILTDSGGVQEEAPILGKPVLVARTETERHLGVAQGAARLVGLDPDRIEAAIAQVVEDPAAFGPNRRTSPYGDGLAGERIARALQGIEIEEFDSDSSSAMAAQLDLPRRKAGGEARAWRHWL